MMLRKLAVLNLFLSYSFFSLQCIYWHTLHHKSKHIYLSKLFKTNAVAFGDNPILIETVLEPEETKFKSMKAIKVITFK